MTSPGMLPVSEYCPFSLFFLIVLTLHFNFIVWAHVTFEFFFLCPLLYIQQYWFFPVFLPTHFCCVNDFYLFSFLISLSLYLISFCFLKKSLLSCWIFALYFYFIEAVAYLIFSYSHEMSGDNFHLLLGNILVSLPNLSVDFPVPFFFFLIFNFYFFKKFKL